MEDWFKTLAVEEELDLQMVSGMVRSWGSCSLLEDGPVEGIAKMEMVRHVLIMVQLGAIAPSWLKRLLSHTLRTA